MSTYIVRISPHGHTDITVEAGSREEAAQLAKEQFNPAWAEWDYTYDAEREEATCD